MKLCKVLLTEQDMLLYVHFNNFVFPNDPSVRSDKYFLKFMSEGEIHQMFLAIACLNLNPAKNTSFTVIKKNLSM